MDTDTTLYVGNLDSQVDEALLHELFVQFAPVQSVRLPKDRVSGKQQGFGFVTLYTEEDVRYVQQVANGLALYNKSIRVNRVNRDRDRDRTGPGGGRP